MQADARTEAAVLAALEQFQSALKQWEVESFLAACVPDDLVV